MDTANIRIHFWIKPPKTISAISRLIENGDRTACENWQSRQLTNLLRHAHTKSKFWRQRMPSRMINYGVLKFLPVQSRQDVAAQVQHEGSLAPNDATSQPYASTGSTGTPVKVYVTRENTYYNAIRSVAPYFFDGLRLEYNYVKIIPECASIRWIASLSL